MALPIVGATIAGSGAAAGGGFLSGVGGMSGLAGLAGAGGNLLGSIGGLFGGGGEEFDMNVAEALRKWQLGDWKFQTDYLRNMQQKDFWRNRELGIEDVKKQGIRLRAAAEQGGFNPLTMLAAQGGMPGAVGGGGVASGPGGGSLPAVMSPGAHTGAAFKAVGNALEMFEQQEDVQIELENERLRDELEQANAGFEGKDPVITKPRPEVTSPEFANSNHKTGEELWVGKEGRTHTESAAVFDQDNMPLEAETEAFGALERGQIKPWAEDLLERNTLDEIDYGFRAGSRERIEKEEAKKRAKDAYDDFNEVEKERQKTRRMFEEDRERHNGTRFFFPSM